MVSVVVAGLAAIDLLLAVLLVFAVAALARERQPDDPHYQPRHARRRSELERVVDANWREVTRHPAPWSQPRRT